MGTFSLRSAEILGKRSVYIVLLVLNATVTLAMMWATRNTMLSDGWSYLGLADGIVHGEYSMWWPLAEDYPDTFRAPGYPLLISMVMMVTGGWKAMIALQLVLYIVALVLALRTVKWFDPRIQVRSVFLLLLLPMVNVPFYITQIYTEIPALAAVSAALYLSTRYKRWSWGKAILVGLLFGFIFQCRPVFLFFPFMSVVIHHVVNKRSSDTRGQLLALTVFVATLLPFGAWNLRNHGVFQVTPLEGAGGYMHFGYWCGKMPGYTEHVYWHNFTGDELVRFTPEDSVAAHIAAFEKEWADIKTQLAPLLTRKDSVMMSERSAMPYAAINSFNTQYTQLREKLLFQKGKEHLLGDLGYTIAYKSYTAMRLWVIGIQRGDYHAASSSGKLKLLFATGVTGLLFLLFIWLVPLAYYRRVLDWRTTWQYLLYLGYFTLIHLPFTIQSRYTLCVRFVMFALLAFAISGLLWGKRGVMNSDDE